MKYRRLILAVLITAAILLGYLSFYLSYASWLVGYAVAHFGGGKHAGRPGQVRSLILSWRNYRFHIHHWFIAFVISVICALKGVYVVTPEIFYGFLGGLVFQGIYYYEDWHRIISRRNLAGLHGNGHFRMLPTPTP